MEDVLHDVPTYRSFAGLDAGQDAMPDESTILRFRHLLEVRGLKRHIFEVASTLPQRPEQSSTVCCSHRDLQLRPK